MNSEEEARYRLKVAKLHRDNAAEEMGFYSEHGERRHLATCVGSAQAAIKNCAKAVICCFHTPTKSHDPSGELMNVLRETSSRLEVPWTSKIERLAEYARKAAPEHGRVIYGDEPRRIPPDELYDEEAAQKSLWMKPWRHTELRMTS